VHFPAWNRRPWARALRRFWLVVLILPLTRILSRTRVRGREHLTALDGPVIFAANHLSHMDTPAIYAALPARYRYRVAPAMAKDFFDAHFKPEGHSLVHVWRIRVSWYLAALLFNAFPIPRREAGKREAFDYMGELVREGHSILIYPEGQMSLDGALLPFKPGVGLMASQLGIPVVPIRLQGYDRILHASWNLPRPGRASIAFGAPLGLTGDDYRALAQRVEDAIRALGES
jgi:long-chain acyl-CoA synthetase